MNVHANLVPRPQARLLMCPPRYFAVDYSINPWMDPRSWADRGADLKAQAARQWDALHRALTATGADIEVLDPAPGLPDLVFTANAAVVLDGRAVLARFRHGERQAEEPVFAEAFAALAARGLVAEVVQLPPQATLEGAGDCIWDKSRDLFWMGCGFRSDKAAAPVLEQALGRPCIPLPLADPRFYHLDTAFCALPCGGIVYFPDAFSAAGVAAIHDRVAPADRIALERADAVRFAANAVCVGRTIVLSSCSAGLRQRLQERGYEVVETPLDVFQRSGGSACCLTLRLDHSAAAAPAAAEALTNTLFAASSRRSA